MAPGLDQGEGMEDALRRWSADHLGASSADFYPEYLDFDSLPLAVAQAQVLSEQESRAAYSHELERIAAQVSQRYHPNQSGSLAFSALERLGKDLNAKARFVTLDGALNFFRGARFWFKNGKTEIDISDGLTAPQARFTLAHELSHLLLGHGDVLLEPLLVERRDMDAARRYIRAQMDASYLASAILMPARLARHTLSEGWFDPWSLSRRFGVTYHTAAHREVILSPFDMHFTLLDLSGKVLKSYSQSSVEAPFPGAVLCGYAASMKSARKAIEAQTRTKVVQFSSFGSGPNYRRVFCLARTVNTVRSDGSSVQRVITIGCDASNAHYFAREDPRIRKPGRNRSERIRLLCSSRCPSWGDCSARPAAAATGPA
jgi:predicted transcriptional regulator